MAIYGLNFNGTPIPPGVKRHFAQRVRVMCPECKGMGYHRADDGEGYEERERCDTCLRGCGTVRADLKGVAQSPEERDAMQIQATNGSRRLHVETRSTAAGEWYGIYTY